MTDIPGSVGKGAPDFCNVYVISKGKIQSMRSAMRPAPTNSALRTQIVKQSSPESDKPLEIQVSPPTTKGQLYFSFILYF